MAKAKTFGSNPGWSVSAWYKCLNPYMQETRSNFLCGHSLPLSLRLAGRIDKHRKNWRIRFERKDCEGEHHETAKALRGWAVALLNPPRQLLK